MTKVLHILTDSNLGGAGRYLINYLDHADRSRFTLQAVLPKGSALVPEIESLEVPVIQLPGIADQSFSRSAIRQFQQVIRREQPEIVHTHGSLSGRIAGKRCGVKVIYTRHCAFPVPGYIRHGPGHWLYGAVNRRYADHVIAVSPAAEENLLQMGVPKRMITVMMNGAPPLERVSPERAAALRQRWDVPEGGFTGGILARLEPYKGHELLLEAAGILRAEGRDFRLLIGGEGSCGQALREQIAALGLEKQVKLLGFVEDVAEVLSLLDVQLNCSWGTETSSIAVIEGMSLGLPTVASSYGGNPWLIDDGRTGLLFENRNPEDLAGKLRALMDDAGLRSRMGREALAAYQERFTAARFAADLERVYDSVLLK